MDDWFFSRISNCIECAIRDQIREQRREGIRAGINNAIDARSRFRGLRNVNHQPVEVLRVNRPVIAHD